MAILQATLGSHWVVLPAKEPTKVFLEKSSECPEVLRRTSWLSVGLSPPILTQPGRAFSPSTNQPCSGSSGLSFPQEAWALSEQEKGSV